MIQMFLNVQMFGIRRTKYLGSNEMFLVITGIFCFLKDCIRIQKILSEFSDNHLRIQGNQGHRNLNVNCFLLPSTTRCCWLHPSMNA